ncbi:uncharacterized protein SETTUDRAFT_162921, partial [Exserohilum turcica Et28A]
MSLPNLEASAMHTFPTPILAPRKSLCHQDIQTNRTMIALGAAARHVKATLTSAIGVGPVCATHRTG